VLCSGALMQRCCGHAARRSKFHSSVLRKALVSCCADVLRMSLVLAIKVLNSRCSVRPCCLL
jgi:hypothetical protein